VQEITLPMRPSRVPSSMPPLDAVPTSQDAPAVLDDDGLTPTDPIMDAVDPSMLRRNSGETGGGVEVEPQRRSRGMAIALILLALLVVLGAWYAVQTFRKVQPEVAAPTSPATP
jgi:hypothetical protein